MKKFIIVTAALYVLGFTAGILNAQELQTVDSKLAAAGVTDAKIDAALAQQEDTLINFGDFFAKARVGYSINQHLEQSTVLYSAVQRFHTTLGVEIANINAGYDTTSKHPIFMTGIRADNLIPMIWGGAWGKKHVTTANLPAIEFGPYCSVWPLIDDGKVTFDFSYGVAFAAGFGK